MSPRSIPRVALPRVIGAVLLLLLLAVVASGQASPSVQQRHLDTAQVYENHSGQALVQLSVYAENGKTHLDRQSLIKITNRATQTVAWQTTDEKSEAAFLLPFDKYEIEVSAVGYLSEPKEFQAYNELQTIRIDIALRKDPNALDLNISDAAMPSKARRDAKRAVSALKSANLKEAKKRLDAAYKLSPSNPDLNYLMGYLFYQQRDLAQARNYLGTATNLNSHSVRALTLLGQLDFIQEDYVGSAAALEKAVDTDSDNWMAHNLLANAYLKLKKYEVARQQAELAIAKGKAASAANLALGQALVNLGNKEEGVKALQAFVQYLPTDPTVPRVRDLIAKLERRDTPAPSDTEIAQMSEAALSGFDPIFASPELPVFVNPWRPPGIDEVKPAVADGVRCPSESVIEQSGERVKELVDDVSRIAAIEHLLHEQVDEMGNPYTKEIRNYNYVASISGKLGVDEYRSGLQTGIADFPDRIATNGFATLALVFHPDMRDSFEMTCEGLGSWHGQAAWLVHFRQREDRPARLSEYRIGGKPYSLRLKGRAWITSDKFEIVRIESELISPMPQIQLRCEQEIVEYRPVQFQKNVELWLPQKAEIYLDYRKHRYYRSHSYDHYMLFSVDSVEKRNEPKAPPTEAIEKPLSN
jgi:Flp pilus assembly protein TadD